jgi:hypothetical protein
VISVFSVVDLKDACSVCALADRPPSALRPELGRFRLLVLFER